jgi:hypothetical protein
VPRELPRCRTHLFPSTAAERSKPGAAASVAAAALAAALTTTIVADATGIPAMQGLVCRLPKHVGNKVRNLHQL